MTGGEAATLAPCRTSVTADEAIHRELELAEAQPANSNIGAARTLHGFFSFTQHSDRTQTVDYGFLWAWGS